MLQKDVEERQQRPAIQPKELGRLLDTSQRALRDAPAVELFPHYELWHGSASSWVAGLWKDRCTRRRFCCKPSMVSVYHI